MLGAWYGPTQRFQTPDDTRRRLERMLARLAAHGIDVPPGSRLARYISLSARFASKELGPAGRGSWRDVNELVEAYRDFAELATIVEHLLPAQSPADPLLFGKIKDVLSGAPFPGEDANALARSMQFELYITALCARGGLAPQFREPDCIVTAGRTRLGIAAKRAVGPKLTRLVKRGARQLRKADLVGVVALSLDRVFAPDDRRIAADNPEGLNAAASEIVFDTVQPHVQALERAIAGSNALAVLAFVVACAVVPRANSIGRIQSVSLCALRDVTEEQAGALMYLSDCLAQSSAL